jgi:hypothetical protein
MQKRVAISMILFAPGLCAAQSAFEGTWRPEPQHPSHSPPEVVLLANGEYECQTCQPPYKVKADGQDHPISGSPYYDTMKIVILDDRSIAKTGKKDGKTTVATLVTVAPGGGFKTEVQTLLGMTPSPIELTMKSSRISAGMSGSHQISGSWKTTEVDVSNHAEDTIFKVNGGALSMSDRMGRSFTAKFDGMAAPYKGSDEFDGVSLKLIDERTIEESDLKNGKVMKISLWALSPDGQTMHARFDDTHGHIQEQDGHKVK